MKVYKDSGFPTKNKILANPPLKLPTFRNWLALLWIIETLGRDSFRLPYYPWCGEVTAWLWNLLIFHITDSPRLAKVWHSCPSPSALPSPCLIKKVHYRTYQNCHRQLLMWWALLSHPCGTTSPRISTFIDVIGDNVMLLQKFGETWITLRCAPTSHVVPCDHIVVFIQDPIWFQLRLFQKVFNNLHTNGGILVGGNALEVDLGGPILLHRLAVATHCWGTIGLKSRTLLDQNKNACIDPIAKLLWLDVPVTNDCKTNVFFLWLKDFMLTVQHRVCERKGQKNWLASGWRYLVVWRW